MILECVRMLIHRLHLSRLRDYQRHLSSWSLFARVCFGFEMIFALLQSAPGPTVSKKMHYGIVR